MTILSPNIKAGNMISLLESWYVKNNFSTITLIKKNNIVLKAESWGVKFLNRAILNLNSHLTSLIGYNKITAGGILNDLKSLSNGVNMYNSTQQEELAVLIASSENSLSRIAEKLNEKPTVLRNKIYRNKKISVNDYNSIKTAVLGKTEKVTATDLIGQTSGLLNDFNTFFNNIIKFVKTNKMIDTSEYFMCQSHTNLLKKELDDLLETIKSTTNKTLEVV